MEEIVMYSDSVFSGNTWDGLRVGLTVDGEVRDLSGFEAQVTFREGSVTGNVVYILKTPTEIVVEDSKYRILPIKIDFPPGSYVGDMVMTDGATAKTYLRILLTVNETTNV